MKVLIRGGLGNQMFQLAFAFVLKKKFGVEFDLIDFTANAAVERKWNLNFFNYTPKKINFFNKYLILFKVIFISKLNKFELIKSTNILVDTRKLIPLSSISSPPTLVSGYWQQYDYYKNFNLELRELFLPNSDFRKLNKSMKKSYTSVAMHVRRGDYASSDFHLVCNSNWYEKAWREMRKKLPKAELFVFSDDILWCKKNINFTTQVIYVSQNETNPYLDLIKMASCDHFIISNSSFSWWAAFLGSYYNKTVIAPRYWFAGVLTEKSGLFIKGWQLID
jgi:hypothetical protein